MQISSIQGTNHNYVPQFKARVNGAHGYLQLNIVYDSCRTNGYLRAIGCICDAFKDDKTVYSIGNSYGVFVEREGKTLLSGGTPGGAFLTILNDLIERNSEEDAKTALISLMEKSEFTTKELIEQLVRHRCDIPS